jgi:hypothetical protein
MESNFQMKKFKEFLENYDPYTDDPSQSRPDGSIKGKGWLGKFKNAKGQDVSEYSVGVPSDELYGMDLPKGAILHKSETLIPTLVPDLDDNEIESVIKATENENKELPDEVMRKAFSHAQRQLSQGKSQFK